jgi:DNA repair protein RadC
LLDRQNKTIGYAKISQGGIFSTVVDVKIIAKYVVDSLASGIILAHNHPSGQLKASNEDIQVTNKIKEVLKHFDCVVLDHVILTVDSYYSMVDNGAI